MDRLLILTQLMIFLEAPPPNVRDRWKRGAEMCAEWGFPCKGASVWRLHRSYALAWRAHLAHESKSACTGTPESIGQDMDQLTAHRTLEALANPHLSPEQFLAFAKLEHRKKILALAQQRYQDDRQDQIDLALELLALEINEHPETRETFDVFRKALADCLVKKMDEDA